MYFIIEGKIDESIQYMDGRSKNELANRSHLLALIQSQVVQGPVSDNFRNYFEKVLNGTYKVSSKFTTTNVCKNYDTFDGSTVININT